jgi:hypothetical protein
MRAVGIPRQRPPARKLARPRRASAFVRRRLAGAALRSEGVHWRPDSRTYAMGGIAVAIVGAAVAVELGRVWHRGHAPLPSETDELLPAAQEAMSEAVEVAVVGYQDVSTRENAAFNMLVSFVVTFVSVRTVTWALRSRDNLGPFRNMIVGRRHIHHFVPGIVLAFGSGAVAILSRDEDLEPHLALVFGAGMGLTLDESALLLELEDVYWSKEGLLGVQISLATMALMGALALAIRFVRRGEQLVLEDGSVNGPGPGPAPAAGSGPAPHPS